MPHIGYNLAVEAIRILTRSVALMLVIGYLVDWALLSPRWIKGLPRVPSYLPIWRNLSLIFPPARDWTQSPCMKLLKLSETYGPVYQIRLGSRLVVVANSYESINQLWCCKNGRGNNSRPMGVTFHSLLSKKGIYTVGTTPWGPEYMRMRKFLASNAFNGTKAKTVNGQIISQEADKMIRRLTEASSGMITSDMTRECQYFHLAVALMLTYGYPIQYPEECSQAVEIAQVENEITKLRSHVQNVQDFLPSVLAWIINSWTHNNQHSSRLYMRRKRYLDKYLDFARTNVAHPSTAVRNSLMYTFFMDGETNISAQQMASVCLTMVSAGLDNTPLNFKYELHQLSHSPHIVDRAYAELLDCYHNDPVEAFNSCHLENRSDYVMAIVKESLRLFTVLPMALPRLTTEQLYYKNAVIPVGTVLYMNCWAGNHDPAALYKPTEFIPERFLAQEPHNLAFGIGSRMCLGQNLAVQELYVLTCKFLLLFTFQKPTMSKLNPLVLNQFPESIAIEPIPFDITMSIRSKSLCKEVLGVLD